VNAAQFAVNIFIAEAITCRGTSPIPSGYGFHDRSPSEPAAEYEAWAREAQFAAFHEKGRGGGGTLSVADVLIESIT
jgi:hypothetical protein